MTEARTQTRREGNKGWENGLPNVKVGSHPSNPLRQRGVGSWKRWTKRVPIATLPVWAFREKRPVFSVNSFSFFWFFSVTLSMRKLLTAFSSERGLKGCCVRLCPGHDGSAKRERIRGCFENPRGC